jgi:hypothetical protein
MIRADVFAKVALEYGDLLHKRGREEVLDVCRQILPASDVDAIESRLREKRRTVGGSALPSATPSASSPDAAANSE